MHASLPCYRIFGHHRSSLALKAAYSGARTLHPISGARFAGLRRWCRALDSGARRSQTNFSNLASTHQLTRPVLAQQQPSRSRCSDHRPAAPHTASSIQLYLDFVCAGVTMAHRASRFPSSSSRPRLGSQYETGPLGSCQAGLEPQTGQACLHQPPLDSETRHLGRGLPTVDNRPTGPLWPLGTGFGMRASCQRELLRALADCRMVPVRAPTQQRASRARARTHSSRAARPSQQNPSSEPE